MKEIIKKYLTQRNRNIISIIVIVLGLSFIINYCFFEPTYINSYIASNVYLEPANSAFEDENFYKCVVDAYNETNNKSVAYTTNLSDAQLKTITSLDCTNKGIVSTNGLEKNSKLQRLDLSYNQLTSIDVSDNIMLDFLDLSYNQLTSIDVSKNTVLTEFFASDNQLIYLDVSKNLKLRDLSVNSNQLTSLDVSKNLVLMYLNVDNNKLTSLDVSKNTKLKDLSVNSNQITSLDVSKNTVLTYLRISKNQLTSLDVSKNTILEDLRAFGNQLTSLVVSGTSALTILHAYNNQLTSLDVSKNTKLKDLSVFENQLPSLDVSKNLKLINLSVNSNQLTSLDVSKNLKLINLSVNSNQLTSLVVSGTSALTILYANNNQLTSLDVSKNLELEGLYVCSNKLTSLDVSKNLKLERLWAYNNQLTSLDVSGNSALSDLLVSNPYSENLYVYKNNSIAIGKNVKIAEHLNWNNPVWTSKNEDIVSVDDTGFVIAKNVGIASVVGVVTNRYNTTSTVNVVEIISDKYKIDEVNNYIFVGSDNDIDIIKSNIKKSSEDIDVNIDIDKYKLYVKHGDEILKEFDIIGLSSKDYDLSKEYIYVKDVELNLELINNKNCDKSIEGNKLVIKHGDTVLYEYKLISVSSEDYDIKDYIYIGTKAKVDIDKITVINGEISLDDNRVIVKYGEEIVDEIDIVSIKIDIDKIFDKYIYVGHKIDLSRIKAVNCTPYVDGNMLFIKYNDKFNVDTYKLLSFNVKDYKMYGKNIVVLEEVVFEEFTSKINKSDELKYKIYNGEEEVTSGNISIGMEVRLYYEEELIDTYKITDIDEFIEINNLDVDDDNKVINNISLGSSIDSIINNISTSGNIKVYDKKDTLIEDNSKNIGTGYKIKIELTDRVEEYVVSVKGDLNGDGKTNINDVIKVAKYLANNNTLVGIEYINAADINSDEKVNINDVIKLAKSLTGGN